MAAIFQFLKPNQPDSTNKKIFRAALAIGLIGLLAKAAVTGKELLIARSFGRSDTLDAFLIAFLLPSFMMNLLVGSLASALIPVLVETRHKQGEEAAQKLVSTMALLSLLALIGIALVLAVLAPIYLPYLGSSFSPEKLRLTRELLYLLLPWIIFNGMAMFAASVLNAGEKFALPAVVPIVTPLVTMLFIVFAAEHWGAFSLAVGAVAGSLVEAVWLAGILQGHGIQLSFKWTGVDDNVRSVMYQYAPMLVGAFLMGSITVVDQSMAAMLPGGSVAALSYANKIVGAVLTIGATALSTAVLPYFSKMAAEGDWHGCRHTLKRFSLLVIMAATPLTLLLMVFSRPLIKLLFQRGAFTSADTELVHWVQICYSIQIPFYICGMLFVRFLSAIRRNDLLMYASALNLAVDIVLNLILMRYWGVAGIALSTSLVYVVSFTFVAVCTVKILSQERFTAAVSVTTGGATP
jgi:putative peptidoglycan lipid II flippase